MRAAVKASLLTLLTTRGGDTELQVGLLSTLNICTRLLLYEALVCISCIYSSLYFVAHIVRHVARRLSQAFMWLLLTCPCAQLGDSRPAVLLIVGVNGSGKTTTVGKMAHMFAQQGASVLLAAADTFRAAAAEQLQLWAQRAGSTFIGPIGDKARPAGVINRVRFCCGCFCVTQHNKI